ncbi:B12-binding domain-containing radical SAM protein [Candidatus Woesearchaeota archaeon]|nr:B12-binding domain-containing radical SAM protein [Candidatus Woesearchaeota archaeon]
MKVVLINPPLIDIKTNFAGIANIPLGITYLAAYLREKGIEVNLIDSFGEAMEKVSPFMEDYVRVGLSPSEIISRIPKDTDFIGISILSSVFHTIGVEIIKEAKKNFPDVPVIIGGNHATFVYKEFLDNDADYVILGEGEESFLELVGGKDPSDIDGLAYKRNGKLLVNPKTKFIKDLNSLPFPARDLIPLKNYWKLGTAHGPVNNKYTSIMTTRGCPFGCRFCSSPAFWQRTFRKVNPARVVDEIEYCIKEFGITEFHFEDDNITLDKNHIIEICKEILRRNLKIAFNTPNGIRADTVDEEVLKWMKKAGCTHITLAPESGSERVLTLMNKKINLKHLENVVRMLNRLKIKTCTFFILGYPGETKKDREVTRNYMKRLVKAGLDETSIGIVIPLPGAEIFAEFRKGVDYKKWEDLLITVPKWRGDYKELGRARMKLFTSFYLSQLIYHPSKIFRHIINPLFGKKETKTDMALVRLLKLFLRRKY